MNVYLGLVITTVTGLGVLFAIEWLVTVWQQGECPQFQDVNRVYDWSEEQEPTCRK